jgi:hypothetical protein
MEEAEAQEEAQAEAQVETQAEAQAETTADDHLAEDHPAEEHQEYLLETPQGEMNQGETTLGMTTNLTTRIRTTIQRTTITEANLLHQGDPKPPQAITGTSLTLWCGETAHPGLKPRVQESLKNAIMPSVNAFMKPFKMLLAMCSDAHQSLLVLMHT